MSRNTLQLMLENKVGRGLRQHHRSFSSVTTRLRESSCSVLQRWSNVVANVAAFWKLQVIDTKKEFFKSKGSIGFATLDHRLTTP
jgi:hypothetical protein